MIEHAAGVVSLERFAEIDHMSHDEMGSLLLDTIAENAKLRELVSHLYECMCNVDADGNHECDSCEYDNAESKCDFVRQMREMGVGVDW